jgi:hypothetical protein
MQSLQQTIGNIMAKKQKKSNLVTMLCTKFFAICETSSVFPNPCNFDLVAYASYKKSKIQTLWPNFGPSHSWGQHISRWFNVNHVGFRMFCASCPNWKPWKNTMSK